MARRWGIDGAVMEWSDEGIVLSARRHGESAAILSLLIGDEPKLRAGLVRHDPNRCHVTAGFNTTESILEFVINAGGVPAIAVAEELIDCHAGRPLPIEG